MDYKNENKNYENTVRKAENVATLASGFDILGLTGSVFIKLFAYL